VFCAELADAGCVGHAECDLASDRMPRGEASIRSTCLPEYRGNGHERRAARLVTHFLRDHTGARVIAT
jgi:hypothetical protein